MKKNRLVAAVVAAALALLPCLGVHAETIKYYHLDALGNVRVVTDQNGNVVERHDYLPFGEECTTGPCATNPGIAGAQPRKFTGKERDSETGLDYFGARYYASKLGRFTTVDPAMTLDANIVDPQRWNRYAYARNNPLRFMDPDGKDVRVANDGMARAMIAIGADVRAQVGELFMMGNANQPPTYWAAGTIVDAVLAPVLPKNEDELKANIEASLFGMAGPLGGAGPRVLANRLAGKAAEAKIAEDLVAEGGTIAGSQVSVRTTHGRRVIDHLVETGGDLTAVEVKSGSATRSAAQRAKDAEIAAGRGTFVGKNAGELKGQTIPVETIERRVP